MHVIISLLLYSLSSYRVEFSVGKFKKDTDASKFCFVMLSSDKALPRWEQVVTKLSYPYSVESHFLWLTWNYIVAPNSDSEQLRNMKKSDFRIPLSLKHVGTKKNIYIYAMYVIRIGSYVYVFYASLPITHVSLNSSVVFHLVLEPGSISANSGNTATHI